MAKKHQKFTNWHIIYHGKSLDSIDIENMLNYLYNKGELVAVCEKDNHYHIAYKALKEIEQCNLRKSLLKYIDCEKDGSILKVAFQVKETYDLLYTIGYVTKEGKILMNTFNNETIDKSKEKFKAGVGEYKIEEKKDKKYLHLRQIGELYTEWLMTQNTYSCDNAWKRWRMTIEWHKIPIDIYMKISFEKLHEWANENLDIRKNKN